ncbi:DUF6415 family natural product biosynthesis protein [Streptomyces sp. NPDC058274]|uniref:DUF6415 family natural product biosynthesis protein n=1 Tax=Streptomyces sp. NPDC058274 TaxID=3346416 RepID=UPI0036ED308B
MPREADLRTAAFAAIGEARRRLDLAPGARYISEIKYVQYLARSVMALSAHLDGRSPRGSAKTSSPAG